MPGLDQQLSLSRRVAIKNTFVDVIDIVSDGNMNLPMKSCPLANFASDSIASADTSPFSGCASSSAYVAESASSQNESSVALQSFLLGISTPTGSQSFDLLTSFGHELQQTAYKVGGFPVGSSTPDGSLYVADGVSSLGCDTHEMPCKVEVPNVELPRSYIRVKNTFLEPCDGEEKYMKENRSGLKTCPILPFRNADFLSAELSPMKVELPSDFLDPVRLQAYEQMSEASTSVGSDSDQEVTQPGCTDAADKASTLLSEPLSKGSSLHEAGACEPCAWFWKPAGCQWGQNCKRCHLCPPGETKVRRKQKKAAIRVLGA